MKKLPITLCVITRNSEERIANMLKKHREFIDEILVIDQDSTDNTKQEAEKYADLVISRRCKGASDPDRNWLFSLSKNKWVLYLDDDEYLDDELIKNLDTLIEQDKIHIYWLKERNLVNGVDIKDLLGDDPHPRLFQRGAMKYLDQQTNVDHTFPKPSEGVNVAYVNYYIVHDRTLEKIKASNRSRNKVATPQQIQMQERFIEQVEVLLAKQK